LQEKKKKALANKRALAKKKEQKKAAFSSKKSDSKAVAEVEIPQDPQAMKEYSLAVAHAAENNEPDEPVNYGTQEEKSEA